MEDKNVLKRPILGLRAVACKWICVCSYPFTFSLSCLGPPKRNSSFFFFSGPIPDERLLDVNGCWSLLHLTSHSYFGFPIRYAWLMDLIRMRVKGALEIFIQYRGNPVCLLEFETRLFEMLLYHLKLRVNYKDKYFCCLKRKVFAGFP